MGCAAAIILMLMPALQSGWAAEGRDGHDGKPAERGGGFSHGRDDVETGAHVLLDLLTQKKAIGLTADQVGKLKALQLDLRHARFRGEAEIEVEEIELRDMLENDTSDLSAIKAKLTLITDLENDLRLKAIQSARVQRCRASIPATTGAGRIGEPGGCPGNRRALHAIADNVRASHPHQRRYSHERASDDGGAGHVPCADRGRIPVLCG